MSNISNLLYENGVQEIFKLKVVEGRFAGVYDINKPSGFDYIDCVLQIDKDNFNVNNFILGDSAKIKIVEYYDEETFNLIQNVYDEQGGDAQILFSWQEEKDGIVTDIIGDNYALNLNKYKRSYEQSRQYIETEVKKRESQNKLLTREDVTVNLFADKDLDENSIAPVNTTDIFYKEPARRFTNFYFYTYGQLPVNLRPTDSFMFSFTRGDGFQFGDNQNVDSGYTQGVPLYIKKYLGSLLNSNTDLTNLKIELSNWVVACVDMSFKLFAIKRREGNDIERILLKSSFVNPEDGNHLLMIKNEIFDLGSLPHFVSVDLLLISDGGDVRFIMGDEQASIELYTDRIIPIRRTPSVLLKDALNQLCALCTSSEIKLESSLIDNGGFYENTAVATGLFLRSLPRVLMGGIKLNTSIKTLLYDSILKLMAGGFDLQNNKLLVESIDFFFKDLLAYDFSDKDFMTKSLEITFDIEETYNSLEFGSKKYSTKNKDDIKSFNTKLEAVTPIKSIKNKFDKTVDCIIDDDKIQESILDSSTSTNENDDDLCFIDLVKLENYVDEGILVDCNHRIENGRLVLVCIQTPFDTLAVQVGDTLQIISGLNVGTWTILEIDRAKAVLNKTSNIQEGVSDTIVKFNLRNITKNRLNEGFTDVTGIKGGGSSNMRHNPKYHMARWFGFYGGNLNKKLNSESIIVSNYKNNGNVTMSWTSPELSNELSGLTRLDANEPLGRFRSYKNTFDYTFE